jgi:hypothetical protein
VTARLVILICACLALAGCGDSRTQPPDLNSPAAPDGFNPVSYPAAGLRFHVPRDWRVIPGTSPQVAVVQSGLATIAVWRYPRDGALPRNVAELKSALHSLLALVAARDPTFVRESDAVVVVADHHAIQIRGLETIDGLRREVRSTHLFVNNSEVVIDAFAPPDVFLRVDTQVFHPMLRSLRVMPVSG